MTALIALAALCAATTVLVAVDLHRRDRGPLWPTLADWCVPADALAWGQLVGPPGDDRIDLLARQLGRITPWTAKAWREAIEGAVALGTPLDWITENRNKLAADPALLSAARHLMSTGWSDDAA